MELLKIDDLTKHFGGLCAISNLTFSVNEANILGVIGPNGAGKTTLFNLISGVYSPTRGDILFKGHSTVGQKPHQICQLGIARTFQKIRLFQRLSVLSNVLVGIYNWDIFSSHQKKTNAEYEKDPIDLATDMLRYVGLKKRKDELAKNLSHGEMRLLEIARALATKPKLLLMDEQASGLSLQEIDQLKKLILEIRSSGISILIIEHLMDFVMSLSDRIIVLDHGVKICEGTPEQVQNDSTVISAYLGQEVKV
jgi:branched-chain amino acid transport system ATP-binding protein